MVDSSQTSVSSLGDELHAFSRLSSELTKRNVALAGLIGASDATTNTWAHERRDLLACVLVFRVQHPQGAQQLKGVQAIFVHVGLFLNLCEACVTATSNDVERKRQCASPVQYMYATTMRRSLHAHDSWSRSALLLWTSARRSFSFPRNSSTLISAV